MPLEFPVAPSAELESLELSQASPEFIVQLLEQVIGAQLSAEKKTSIFGVVSELPEDATMRDLCEAIKVQEAASLGVTAEQYEVLSPVLDALQGLLAPGDYAGLFEQPADAQEK